ncbi:hypothetical protein B484DRAFT_441014, partial [Ochromonadaceae sp. CCMP2298]
MNTTPFRQTLKLDKSFTTSIYKPKTRIKEYVLKSQIVSLLENHKDTLINYSPDSYQHRYFTDEKAQLNRIMEGMDSDHFEATYNLPKHKWGRVIPSFYKSLSIMHRPTRHAVCVKLYIDLDFENCEANVLFECVSQYLIGHPEQSVDMSSLEEYCEKPKFIRDILIEYYEVEDEVVSGRKSITKKDKIKGLLIGLMNGGSQDKFRSHNKITKPDHEFVISFKQEIQNIMTIVFKFNEHIVDAILKETPSHFEDKNTSGRAMSAVSLEKAKKRTCMAFFYQTIERKMQESAILTITTTYSVPIESIVPCQD